MIPSDTPSIDPRARPLLTTAEAAQVLCRKPQTLRKWAAMECGPIRPVRVFGRLGWKTEDVLRLVREGDK